MKQYFTIIVLVVLSTVVAVAQNEAPNMKPIWVFSMSGPTSFIKPLGLATL